MIDSCGTVHCWPVILNGIFYPYPKALVVTLCYKRVELIIFGLEETVFNATPTFLLNFTKKCEFPQNLGSIPFTFILVNCIIQVDIVAVSVINNASSKHIRFFILYDHFMFLTS